MSRALTAVLTLALLAAPLAAGAQQAGKVYRVGVIFITAPLSELAGPEPVSPSLRALVQGLRALGSVEGQNLILERRSAGRRHERSGDIVTELVSLWYGSVWKYGLHGQGDVHPGRSDRRAPAPDGIPPG